MEPQTETSTNNSLSPIEQYGAYPFNTDLEYQQGLGNIMLGWSLDKEPSAETREEMLRRTRVFYFNKLTGNSVTLDEAREYELSKIAKAVSPSPPKDESEHILSFAELKHLLETGKVDQIPFNKIIPNKLTEEAPSQSTASLRKKPWEVAAVPENDTSAST